MTVYANVAYALSESPASGSNVSGYTAGSWSCTGGTLVGSTVTLTEGETNVTCAITNDDIAPTLKLVKSVINDNGGNAVADDWMLFATTAEEFYEDRNFSNLGDSGVFETVYANVAYALSESRARVERDRLHGRLLVLHWRYASRFDRDAHRGRNGRHLHHHQRRHRPTLTLVKTVVNDNGGTARWLTSRCSSTATP